MDARLGPVKAGLLTHGGFVMTELCGLGVEIFGPY